MIRVNKLKHRCQQSINSLLYGKQWRHIDRGSNILGVAHVDVAPSIKSIAHNFSVKDNKVYSPALDDRLGVYILLDLLDVDVLLTTDEEIGRSTAQFFETSKNYNWIFQFDRHGIDVVMYQYETLANIELLNSYDFHVGLGSFSDICYLDHLGIAGFNFGTGYYNEHTKYCYANLDETAKQVKKFNLFLNAMQDTKIPYTINTIDDTEQLYEDYVCDYCQVEEPIEYFLKYDAMLCGGCIQFLNM